MINKARDFNLYMYVAISVDFLVRGFEGMQFYSLNEGENSLILNLGIEMRSYPSTAGTLTKTLY